MPRRTTRPTSAERRESLLRAAEELFADRSYDEVSMDDIADAVDVAHGLPFHYFGNKLGLYLAMLDSWNARRQVLFEQNTEDDPARWFRTELDIILDQAAEGRETYISVVRNSAGAEVGEVRAHLRRQVAARLIDKLAPTRESPLLRLAVAAWISFEGELVASWVEAGDESGDEVKHILTEVLAAALTAAAGFDPRAFSDTRRERSVGRGAEDSRPSAGIDP